MEYDFLIVEFRTLRYMVSWYFYREHMIYYVQFVARSDVSGFIIRALRSMAESPVLTREENPLQCCNRKEIDSIWRSIWFETLKSIHSRKIDGFGFKLLTSILKVSCVKLNLMKSTS